jgi:hypothetical protein
MRAAHKLEKITAQIEGLNHSFISSEQQEEYENMRSQVVDLLNEMTDLIHTDSETEQDTTEND